MNTYIPLLDQMPSFFQIQFSKLPIELQNKLNQKEIDRPHIEISAEVSKWDELSPLQREYLAALYDFHFSPNHIEKATAEKLIESIMPYMERRFSDLPQQMKMNIAYVDIFQLWDEISIEQRKYMACDFDNRMHATYKNSENREFVIEYFDIKKEWDKFALQRELLAEEAIPLMHGCDPYSWEEYGKNVKSLPEEMIRSIKRYLKIAQADGLTKSAPSQWLIWGRFHHLDKLIIESYLGSSESEVSMWELFESAVNDYIKEHWRFNG